MLRSRTNKPGVLAALLMVIMALGSCQSDTDDQRGEAPARSEGEASQSQPAVERATGSPVVSTPTPAPTPTPTSTPTPTPEAATVVLGFENWDYAMKDAWEGPIAAAFEKAHPDLAFSYLTTSAPEYNEELLGRLEQGTAEDLIACRPFTGSKKLFDAGYLATLDDLDSGVLPASAYEAWSTTDGTRFCVPITSTMQGFMYNTDIFAELGLDPPDTLDEFHTVLEAIAVDGRYVPLAIGLADPWRMGDLGVNVMGPTFWEGEQGRQQLFTGEVDFTDDRFVALFEEIASWRPYLPEDAEFVDGAGATDLFNTGRAAIYPAGSWYTANLVDINFTVGAFAPPRRDESQPCYVVDQPDLGIGLNAASPHQDEAKVFLGWLATPDFVDLAAESFAGRYPMGETTNTSPNPVDAEFQSWRTTCIPSMRLGTAFPSSPTFSDRDAWDLVGAVVTGDITAEEAVQSLQRGFGPALENANS